MTWSRLLSLLTFQILLQSTAAVTCFGFAGTPYTDNVICPGSNSCCGSSATCLSNRLCHNPGDNNATFVRGPCAVKPYDPATCAQICLFNETTGFLPRVNICDDGRYCCSDDPQCCGNKSGVFLNTLGDIVTSLPSSKSQVATTTTSSSVSSSSTTSLTLSTSTVASSTLSEQPRATSSAPISSATSEESSGLATAAKISLGVGIPLGVLIFAALGAIIWYQQRRIRQASAYAKQEHHLEPEYSTKQLQLQHMSPKEMESISRWSPNTTVAELPAHQSYLKYG